MLSEVNKILDISKSTIPKLKFNNQQTEIYAVALWGTLIEYSSSTIKLIESGSIWGVDSILRTMLEAHMDLINLSHIEDYHKRLELNSYIEAQRLEDEICQDSCFIDKRNDFTQIIKEYKANGVRELRFKEKLALASEENVHKIAYRVLCQQSHNNIQALVARHYKTDENNQLTGIEYFRPKTKDDIDTIIDTTAGMLTTGLKLIQAILDLDLNVEVEAAEKELVGLRS